MNFPCHVTIVSEWRDKTTNGYLATVGKQFCYFGHTSNILLTIILAETQILIEARTNVVTVQSIRGNSVRHQKRFQFEGNRCFARSTQTSQPDGAAAKATAQIPTAHLPCNMMFLFAHICRHLKALEEREKMKCKKEKANVEN